MKSGRTSTLDSWISGSAPGIAAGDPSPTRKGGVPTPFTRFASNQWTTGPEPEASAPLSRVGLGIACGNFPAPTGSPAGQTS